MKVFSLAAMFLLALVSVVSAISGKVLSNWEERLVMALVGIGFAILAVAWKGEK